jgi:hypothetical protein
VVGHVTDGWAAVTRLRPIRLRLLVRSALSSHFGMNTNLSIYCAGREIAITQKAQALHTRGGALLCGSEGDAVVGGFLLTGIAFTGRKP